MLDGTDGWDGMVIIGHRSSKNTQKDSLLAFCFCMYESIKYVKHLLDNLSAKAHAKVNKHTMLRRKRWYSFCDIVTIFELCCSVNRIFTTLEVV